MRDSRKGYNDIHLSKIYIFFVKETNGLRKFDLSNIYQVDLVEPGQHFYTMTEKILSPCLIT